MVRRRTDGDAGVDPALAGTVTSVGVIGVASALEDPRHDARCDDNGGDGGGGGGGDGGDDGDGGDGGDGGDV